MLSRLSFAGATLVLSALSSPAAAAGSLTEYTAFGSNPGNLRMFGYVPTGFPANGPLAVVAPGCAQTAQDIADTSGWIELADKYKIALIFPQTSYANEPSGACFRTWLPAHQMRGAGEPLSVKQMIDFFEAHFTISREGSILPACRRAAISPM